MKYITIQRAQFYRWRQNSVKAKDGALPEGVVFETNQVIDPYVIVQYALSDYGGNEPPYAIRLDDLQEVIDIPNPDEGTGGAVTVPPITFEVTAPETVSLLTSILAISRHLNI